MAQCKQDWAQAELGTAALKEVLLKGVAGRAELYNQAAADLLTRRAELWRENASRCSVGAGGWRGDSAGVGGQPGAGRPTRTGSSLKAGLLWSPQLGPRT